MRRTRHASVLLCLAECGAGCRARRRGNFLLRGQKKVTKEEALNRTPSRRRQWRRAKTAGVVVGTREPLRSRCCPYDERHAARFGPLNVGCTPNSPGNTLNAASLGRRQTDAALGSRRPSDALRISGEPGVQPRVTRAGGAMSDGRHKDSSESAAGRVWAASLVVVFARRSWRRRGRVRFRASSLVTFFWPRRRKLPRRRARHPAPHSARHRSTEACLSDFQRRHP
jgi:hypothetical protein